MDQPTRRPWGPMKSESRSRWGCGAAAGTSGISGCRCGSIDDPSLAEISSPGEDGRKGTHQHNQFEGLNAAAPAANARPGPLGVPRDYGCFSEGWLATWRLLVTLKTPGTELARMLAVSLSACESTTP